ncbi:unnamed protein product [Vicia faba]|uniref:Uncharacterized protein n=1 Tax=Vicia faba TaxID=3906 RepID=A0AAV0YUA2_VICFA|nr:unnamed protein product [Vicia faba]
MNVNKSKHYVTNKGKKVFMKKVIYEEDIRSLQDLGIDKASMYEEERSTKMSKNMFQHLAQKSELSHEDWVIEGKANGQTGGPPNFEQPTSVRKKKLKKNGYDIVHPNRTTSHMFESVINQRHDKMIGEEKDDVLKSSRKRHDYIIVDKSDLASSGSISVVSLGFGSIRSYHDEDYHGTILRKHDGDKDVTDIPYDMLKEPQVHKVNKNHVHEDSEVDSAITNGDVVNNHDHALEDVKTLSEGVNEIHFTTNGKEYKLISNDMTT